MSSIDFTDNTTVVPAAWLDDVDAAIYEQTGVGKTTVASATTPDIFAVTTGRLIDYTGTATCTGFVAAVSAGSERTLYCADAAVFTAGTNLLIDGVATGSNLTCVAADILDVVAITTTQWKITKRTTNQSVLTAEQATTSGSTITFSSIPSWAKRITIMFVGVSTSGATTPLYMQLGDAGGTETSGYLGSAAKTTDSLATVGVNLTTGFPIDANSTNPMTRHGKIELVLQKASTNTWVYTSMMGRSDTGSACVAGGSKSLSQALTSVAISCLPTDTFDAGAISIMYE